MSALVSGLSPPGPGGVRNPRGNGGLTDSGSWGNLHFIYLRLSSDHIPGGTLPNPGGLESLVSQPSQKEKLSSAESD